MRTTPFPQDIAKMILSYLASQKETFSYSDIESMVTRALAIIKEAPLLEFEEDETNPLYKAYERKEDQHLNDLRKKASTVTGKAAREVHKELRRYGYVVPLSARYPYFPLVLSIIALGIATTTMILRLLRRI